MPLDCTLRLVTDVPEHPAHPLHVALGGLLLRVQVVEDDGQPQAGPRHAVVHILPGSRRSGCGHLSIIYQHILLSQAQTKAKI